LDLPELRNLGANLSTARRDRGYSQGELARECKLAQTQVSLFETGRRLPSLEQLVRLARALDFPLQRLLTGADRQGVDIKDLAVELRGLGAVDLWVAGAAVPGAARRPEEVIALAVSGGTPDPRVVETLPALLSWNEIHPAVLRGHGIVTRTTYRLAWLADVALALDRQHGFPGGCRRAPLERFLKTVKSPPAGAAWDDLGRPSRDPPRSPVWKRWKVSYDATADEFERRATELAAPRDAPKSPAGPRSVHLQVTAEATRVTKPAPTSTTGRVEAAVAPSTVRKGQPDGR
jgi:transcriptional regulator with XRE-family HTH domain